MPSQSGSSTARADVVRAAVGIDRLAALWQGQTAPGVRRACLGAIGVSLTAAVLTGRTGLDFARPLAIALAALGFVPMIASRLWARHRAGDPRRVLSATILHTQPELGRAALRALSLTERTSDRADTGSPELALLHLGRVLGRAALDPVVMRADARAWLWSALGIAGACLAFAAVAIDPFRMVEGVDVLAARAGVAPIPLEWTDEVDTAAEPPAYLDVPRAPIRTHYPVALPVGTNITVHATARHPGRELVLFDGEKQAPFHDDGHGALVARWQVERDASITVAAKFGAVLVPEPNRLDVSAITDLTPMVRLAKAPATLKLLDFPRIPIHWEVIDDHGLREVMLVLRAGDREERRPLSKPQGGAVTDRGGIDLLPHDKFLEKSYVPIEVTVEALDNDPISGPKWGRSESILLIPPQIGELEALRHRALSAARDALSDLLAGRVKVDPPRDRAAWAAAQKNEQHAALALVAAALKHDFGGLRIPGRVTAAARGQMERLERALADATRTADKPSLEKLREANENSLLAFDAILDALGDRDSRGAALKLADVAQEAASAIKLGREPFERSRADRRLAADVSVLAGGGKNLVVLGALGRDLGEIIENDLGRIARAMQDGDRLHARLAAEDLAARLRQPDPSFGSSGGGGGGGGTESGGPPQDGPASEAASEAAGIEQALEELRREHAAEMAGVERALDEATSEEEKQALNDQLKKLADQARRAVEELPEQASDPGSARSAGAEGRSQAEGMAAALERGELSEAADSGKRALDSLDRAQKKGSEANEGSGERDVGDQAGVAAGKLRDLVKEADRRLSEMRKKASESAAAALEQAARREKSLAERARRIREQSEGSEAPLPGPMLDKLGEAAKEMEDAGKELGEHRGSKGLERQRQAQRLLEMAQPESEQEGERRGRPQDGPQLAQNAEVPEEHQDEGASRFKKRVTDGLGKKTPQRLREAVRRYTEGLLR